jgi:hypothetical protein
MVLLIDVMGHSSLIIVKQGGLSLEACNWQNSTSIPLLIAGY